MPYSIVIVIAGKETESSPIANDKPSCPLQMEDPRIEHKCQMVVGKLLKDKDIEKAYVKHTLPTM